MEVISWKNMPIFTEIIILLYLDPNESQGGVIFALAPRLFVYPKRRTGYARCSLTGNKNYPAITKLTNTMKGYATSANKTCTWLAIYPVYEQRRSMNG